MKRVVSLWILGVLMVCGTASAQKRPKAPPPPQVVDPAKVHIDQGAALYNDGNYSAALAEFEEAYRINPAAFILNNIGLTQKALFRYTEAIASLQKFLDDSPTLSPTVRAQTEQIIAEIKALLAPVTLTVTPAGAAITIDGRPAGAAPIAAPLSIAAGSHAIEVTADGYVPVKRDIMVSAGVPLALELALKAIPTTGKVHIVTQPPATILIDGHVVGSSTAELDLSAGGHTLEVSAVGYNRHREEVNLAAGQAREISVTLDPSARPKHWYQKWYVWAPIAVVVVGTVGGLAIEFGTYQSPTAGSLGLGKSQ